MSHADFVHLHLHSEYSMLDGACRLDRLVKKANELRFPALALTDHGVLYGAVDFYKQAQEGGVKPIVGCEVYMAYGDHKEKKAGPGGRDNYHHLVLLVKDETGYSNLVKLVTAAHLDGYYYKPRIDKKLLAAHKEGLIALSACLAGEIPELIVHEQLGQARDVIDWYKQTLGAENFYLELQDHNIPEEKVVNRQLIPWAREFGLKLVATNDVHYIQKEHSHAHDVLICIGTQTTIHDQNRLSLSYPPEQFYLRSAEDMKDLFKEVPEAISNTLEVAEQCNLELRFGTPHYPSFDPPKPFTREGYLRHLLVEGLARHYGISAHVGEKGILADSVADARRLPTYVQPASAGEAAAEENAQPVAGPASDLNDPAVHTAVRELMDRLRLELNTIEHTEFTSYFLIVHDLVSHARGKGVQCGARGSAAGSLVTYLLDISYVDPLRYGLLFERFLNPERINPPDIDVDFADDRRAEVIKYVREKYGEDSVAQIITFGTMGAKSVVRDVGRAMGLDYSQCDRLAKMIPNDPKMTLTKALTDSPDLRRAYGADETTRDLIDTALILEDLTRNASVHAAGVVIGGQALVEVLPLKRDEDGTIVTQYAMGPVDALGLMKMDFLGLKTLTVIRNTCDMIKATTGVDVRVDDLPLDDSKTYDLLNRAATLGVFQLESGGMRDLCRKFRISSIEHITALIALYRPGPMELIPEFIRRRHGEMGTESEHPLLDPICKETYGIMVYQEQVMQAARVLAGYSLGRADILRRAMGKKKAEEMAKQRKAFVDGCAEKNQIPHAKANRIFDLLERFAGYGFNKSHAAAYAVVAYQTAYLKAHCPVQFLCAIMTNDMSDTDKLSQYIEEARATGIEVLPPDVNDSGVVFTPARGGKVIRFGLAAIKGVGEVAVQSVLKARDEGGRFMSLSDFCHRVDLRAVNRKAIEALIKCGACDAFGETRATLANVLERTMAAAASIAHDRARGQATLFGSLQDAPRFEIDPSQRKPEWPQNQLLSHEKELLGFYVTGHPLTPFVPVIEKYSLVDAAGLGALPNRSMTRIGGLIATVQHGISKKNSKPYLIATLEDLTGSVQVLCMNECYEKCRELVTANAAVFAIGEVSTGEDKPKLFAQEIVPLADAPKRYTLQVHFRINTAHLTTDLLRTASELAIAHSGTCPLVLCLIRASGEYVFIQTGERFKVTPSLELETTVNDLFGKGAYYAKCDSSLPARPQRKWERNGENGSSERGGQGGGGRGSNNQSPEG